jgi:small subunit ribosomal protein S8
LSPIANILTQIKNAQSRGQEEVILPFSKMAFDIVRILEDEGFVGGVEKKTRRAKKSELDILSVKLKYNEGVGAIDGVKLVSKPSRRVYAGKDGLRSAEREHGISVVSTSKGLMTGDEARKMGIGGEIICEVW